MTPEEILEKVKQFNCDEMSQFLTSLGAYFYYNEGQLTNMDAKDIGVHIVYASIILDKRTGN